MTRLARIVVAASVAGALAGGLSLVAAFALHPGVALDLDRDLPAHVTSGFYPVERSGDETFAWTGRRAELVLAGADRRTPWRCVVRYRGARPPGVLPPIVRLEANGVTLDTRTATGEYQDVAADVPPAAGSGIRLAVVTSSTFVPGRGDGRALGVQINRFACQPAGGTLPPARAIRNAAIATALFGAGFGLAGASLWGAIGGTLAVGAAQAYPFSIGLAPYSAYADRIPWLAFWISGAMAVATVLLDGLGSRRHRLEGTARFAVAFSAAALYLKLLALMHPAKLIEDALFHAHRLGWVLDGRLFFSQPLPSGVQFPYAIAFYVFAAPWAHVARDHVALLRIVAQSSEVFAGALLYWVCVSTWGDRLAGAAAVVLFNCVPITFWVTGNANLTNMFGQAAALVALAAATVWPLRFRQPGRPLALTALMAVALLSHVSTFGLCVATVVALAALYLAVGGRELREPGAVLLAALAAAVVVSLIVYYGRFGDVYRTLDRVGAPAPAAHAAAPPRPTPTLTLTPTPGPVLGPTSGPTPALTPAPMTHRLADAVGLSARSIGWPLVLLGGMGVWRVAAERRRDRLVWLVAAWGMAWLALSAFAVFVPVDARFERYAAEFISRVADATYPAAVVLSALALVWAWRSGWIGRAASTLLALSAIGIAIREWMRWIE